MLLLIQGINKVTPPRKVSPIVCSCLGVTEDQVLAAIDAGGLRTVKQVRACTGAGDGCTSCHPAIRECLARRRAAPNAPTYAASSPSFSAR